MLTEFKIGLLIVASLVAVFLLAKSDGKKWWNGDTRGVAWGLVGVLVLSAAGIQVVETAP